MDVRKFMPLLMLLLFIGTAAATCIDHNTEVGTVTFTKNEFTNACIDYEWSHTQSPDDFNNYIIKASGDVTLGDTNYGGKSFTLCTVEPGDTVTFYVQAFDGDSHGHACSFDFNTTINTPGYAGAARLMVYTIFIVLGGFIGILIFVGVAIWGIKAMGIRIPGLGMKK